ncbi:hypothetical protein I302_102533 [Kwoniella bestiolae CBS 10118]|uniref:Uncharacterized protein n=1 Tax=Kwoniella bestiolae CBS 10118 TaxID=1296100 RepID=A0A1B9GFB7_9TREE|nr:hypothetical protein I302_01221 [Kwoniella bestiolae CBS 10118]OCF29709.1 hypothetical protein I302_01221 [Kwoniella bestiolae CBS 10118]
MGENKEEAKGKIDRKSFAASLNDLRALMDEVIAKAESLFSQDSSEARAPLPSLDDSNKMDENDIMVDEDGRPLAFQEAFSPAPDDCKKPKGESVDDGGADVIAGQGASGSGGLAQQGGIDAGHQVQEVTGMKDAEKMRAAEELKASW